MTPARPRPPRAVRWRHRLRSAFTERLSLKGTAVFLALVLWVITSTREETEELLPVRFAPTLDRALVLQGEPPQVRALVRGLGREVLKLRQTPPVIRRTIAGDLPDTLTIELRPGDVDLPPGVDARVLDVRPRAVTLTFQPIVARMVPVRSALRVRPDRRGRVAAELFFEPESVRVIGRRRGVARVNAIRTVPDTLPAREGAVHTVALDTAGLRALGVIVRPVRVRVRVARLELVDSAFTDAEFDAPPAPRVTERRPPPIAAPVTPAPTTPPRGDSSAKRDTSKAVPPDTTSPPAAGTSQPRDSVAPPRRKVP